MLNARLPVTSFQTSPVIAKPSLTPEDARVVEVQVVPFDTSKLPDVLGATKLTADVPFPKTTLLAVRVERPVPPSATAKSVIPVIEPPVILTLLAFWVDIVPSEPVAAVIAVGVPVNDGDTEEIAPENTAVEADKAPVKDVVPVTSKLPFTV